MWWKLLENILGVKSCVTYICSLLTSSSIPVLVKLPSSTDIFVWAWKERTTCIIKRIKNRKQKKRLKKFSFLRCWVNNHLPLVIVPQKFEPKIKMLPFDWSKSNLNQFYQEQLPKKGDILNQLFITSVYHVGCIDSI